MADVKIVPQAPDNELVEARTAALGFYSPYNFLRAIPMARQQELFGAGAARRFGARPPHEQIVTTGAVQWLLRFLPWDSEYFRTPTYRLFTGLFATDTSADALRTAAVQLREQLQKRGDFYAFSIIPAEDHRLLQALTKAGWALVETRLTFYHDGVADFAAPSYAVRSARPDEADYIGRIAASARNPYDRFHADPWFGDTRADAFLARYAEAAVSGSYADTVLVPDEPGLALDSFLAISDLWTDAKALEVEMSRVLLTAVGPANRGWHRKLVSETLRRAQALLHQYVLMTTQATNPAVFRTAKKLGFKLGATSHVLACHS